MTQEQKDLVLKDLCARLPYRAKVHTPLKPICTIFSKPTIYSTVVIDGAGEEVCNISDIKPYLFPLSSMTEEQKKDIFHNGKFYIDRHNSLCRFPMYEDDYDFVTMEDCLEIFNKLNKYHFDYRGLIEKGLAIDATNLNIY